MSTMRPQCLLHDTLVSKIPRGISKARRYGGQLCSRPRYVLGSIGTYLRSHRAALLSKNGRKPRRLIRCPQTRSDLTLLGAAGQRRLSYAFTRTVGHAHRVLSKALKDAVANEELIKNVAKAKTAPKVTTDEMVIVRDVPGLVGMLPRGPIYAPAMIALFGV